MPKLNSDEKTKEKKTKRRNDPQVNRMRKKCDEREKYSTKIRNIIAEGEAKWKKKCNYVRIITMRCASFIWKKFPRVSLRFASNASAQKLTTNWKETTKTTTTKNENFYSCEQNQIVQLLFFRFQSKVYGILFEIQHRSKCKK